MQAQTILIRRPRISPAFQKPYVDPSSNRFEWQPVDSKSGRWYSVRRERITYASKITNRTTYGTAIQNFNNLMAEGYVLKVQGVYIREAKTLYIEIDEMTIVREPNA